MGKVVEVLRRIDVDEEWLKNALAPWLNALREIARVNCSLNAAAKPLYSKTFR